MTQQESVITVEEWEHAREQSGSEWDDAEVFFEERDDAPLREVVLEVVEGQYTHPDGPDTLYGMEGSAQELVWDKVFSCDMVPEGVPEDVRKSFAKEFSEEVCEYAEKLFKATEDEVKENSAFDEDTGDYVYVVSTVRDIIEPKAEEIVPEHF